MYNCTIQIYIPQEGWRSAASLRFLSKNEVAIDYDIEYASRYMGQNSIRAVSLTLPIDIQPYRGRIPGFLLDLIPQGDPLRRLRSRYHIKEEDNFGEILSKAPLAAPGNLRILEAWTELDNIRKTYNHKGFKLQEILDHHTDFISYMEEHGAPVGGTSGAGGGSPKFLLREDFQGHFHAEGMLDDKKTKHSYLVKFPYTDHSNSILISQTEKLFYDLLRTLPISTGSEIQIHNNILFIKRFDRVITPHKKIDYLGLESLYSAHNINIHGSKLWHEDNLRLIHKYSSSASEDIVEYLKRDILNKILANTDNHGRNTSFLKSENWVRLSPIYDVTAMKFFTGDFIVELTRWHKEHQELQDQIAWMAEEFSIPLKTLLEELKNLYLSLDNIEKKLSNLGVSKDFIERSYDERQQTIRSLKKLVST